MAVATSVQTLTDKLNAMLADEELTITHQRSTEQIRRCVEALQELMLFLAPDQEIHIVEKLEKNRDLLGRIYAAEDCVDTFTVNVQQQLHRRRAVFFAEPLWFALRRASTRRQIRLVGGQMNELAGEIEGILVTLPDLSRNIGEPSFQDGFSVHILPKDENEAGSVDFRKSFSFSPSNTQIHIRSIPMSGGFAITFSYP